MVMPLMELTVIFRVDLHCELQCHDNKLEQKIAKLSTSTDIPVCHRVIHAKPLAAGKVCGEVADSAQTNSERKCDKYISLVYI